MNVYFTRAANIEIRIGTRFLRSSNYTSYMGFIVTIYLSIYSTIYSIFKIILFIFVWAGSSLLHGLFSSNGKRELLSRCGMWTSRCGCFSCVEHGLSGAWALVVSDPRLQSTDSIVVAQEFSCSTAGEIFHDQGSILCLLHWQMGSLPLSQQGSPSFHFLAEFYQVNYSFQLFVLQFSFLCMYTACSVVSDSLQPHGQQPARTVVLCPWNGVFQSRILEWVAISFSRGSFQPRDQTHVSCIGRQILYH